MTTDAKDPRVEAACKAIWPRFPAAQNMTISGDESLWRSYVSIALSAADAARPVVSDEELDMVLTGVIGGLVARLMREKLHAAGFVVVRR